MQSTTPPLTPDRPSPPAHTAPLPAASSPLAGPTHFPDSPGPAHVPADATLPLQPMFTPHIAPLSRADVRKDPILSTLASKQGVSFDSPAPVVPFKARPAPARSAPKAAPRLSKAAALRMGVWAPKTKVQPKENAAPPPETAKEGIKSRPSMNIASLATPSFAPRQNRAAQLRAAGPTTPTGTTPTDKPASKPRKTPEELAAERKARAAEEREKRRQSVALPASLSAPVIAPRMNRTSTLRAAPGTMPPPALPPSAFKRHSALMSTTANNVPASTSAGTAPAGPGADAALRRRSTVGAGTLKSLGAPSITPRLNKTALLRANPTAPATQAQSTPRSNSRARPSTSAGITQGPGAGVGTSTSTTRPSLLSRPTQSSIAKSVSRPATVAGASDADAGMRAAMAKRESIVAIVPKATKASLLRAGLGAKVQASK